MTPPPFDTLCYGDCLDWMQRWDDATVDLIYLDPPFNSNASYNLLAGITSPAGGAIHLPRRRAGHQPGDVQPAVCTASGARAAADLGKKLACFTQEYPSVTRGWMIGHATCNITILLHYFANIGNDSSGLSTAVMRLRVTWV